MEPGPMHTGNRQPGVSRRSFLRLVGAAAAGGTLAACTPGGVRSPLATPGEKVQLVYQDWRTEWFPEMAQRMLAEFHTTHPNIRVFYTPDPDNIADLMPQDMEAGTAPDVLQGCCESLPSWAQRGYLLDLRPYVEADIDRATIAEWDAAQYSAFFLPDGRQFALPKYHGALAVYFNKTLFDTFRVDYPDARWTYDDYREAMARLTQDRDADGQIDLWGSMLDIAWDRLQVHANAWGGRFVDPANPRHSLLAEQPALDALEWVRARIWDDRVMASFLDVQNVETRQAFTEQRIAMVEDGSWALKDILENANFQLGVVSMPAGPQRRVTLATTDGFAIYAGTRHPEAAWELVKFLISREYGQAMIHANLLQPARESLVDEWVKAIHDEYPTMSKNLGVDVFADGHRQGYSVTAEIFANHTEAWRVLRPAWEEIFRLGKAPVSLLKQVSDQIEAAQASGG